MERRFVYSYKGKDYPVIVKIKRMKNITYRFRDDTFYVSAPIFVSLTKIKEGIEKFAPRLTKTKLKEEELDKNNIMYLFGYSFNYNPDGGSVKLSDGNELIYSNKDELIKLLKKTYHKVMEDRTHYYEKIMGINPPYKVKIKSMTSRFGSNSRKTHSIQYADNLYPYSVNILDSLIVHELAHHFVFNHSKDFYKIVLKYYPNYYKENKKLKRREYK